MAIILTDDPVDVTDDLLDDDVRQRFDDAELTAQALAATPVATADDDAINYWDVVAPRDLGILPAWYMPSPSAGSRRLVGWRRRVVYLIIISIALIDAVGLCVTYGRVTFG